MKARTRTALVPLVLLALFALAVGIGFVAELRAADAQARADDEARLLRFRADEVQALSVSARGETVRVARAAGGWRLVAPLSAPADGAAVNALLDALAGLRRRSTVEPAGDLSRFGLTVPRARLTLELAGGRREALALGDRIPLDGTAYARAGAGPVAVLTRDPGPALERSALDLRERRLLGPAAVPTRIEVGGPGTGYTLEQSSGRWRITAPLSEPADQGTAELVASALGALTATGFERATRPDAEYGLDRPVRDVRVTLANRAVRLQFGAPRVAAGAPPEGYLWVRQEGDPELSTVPAVAALALDQPLEALRDHAVLAFDAARVSRVRIRAGAAAVDLARVAGAGGGWALTAPRPGPARREAVDALLSALSGLRALRVAGDGEAIARASGLAPPARAVELLAADGALVAQLDLGREEGDAVAVRPGGSARVFLVPRSVAAAVPASVEALAGAARPGP